jgi:hydrogenase expression/formation protein HypC
MCLAIPSKIIEIHKDNLATVDTLGARREISLDLMPEPAKVGDYLLIHVGYAIAKLKEAEAKETLMLYEEMMGNADE